MIVEFFREPDAHLGFVMDPLTMGQLLSAPMVALGVLMLVRGFSLAPDASSAPHRRGTEVFLRLITLTA